MFYKGMDLWRQYGEFFPEHNRITEQSAPEERYWDWEGNKIHIEHYLNPDAKVKIMMLHGVGGNGRVLSFMAAPLYKDGFEIIAPDLPGYGLSKVSNRPIVYADWVRMVSDLVTEESKKDSRPIVLFGLSAGGMLSYHAACLNDQVKGLIASSLLDLRNQEVRDGSASNKFVSRVGMPFIMLLSKLVPGFPLPMKAVANMNALVNDAKLLKLMISDKTSAGATVPLGFIATMAVAAPAIEPDQFDRCPLLLVHPAADRWTPVRISQLFFDRLKCKKKLVLLENAGHLPVESPGLQQMEQAIVDFLSQFTALSS